MTTQGFTCCETPIPWPARQEDQQCPDCGLIWEREPVDLGAGARIKQDQTGSWASSGPGVVPSLVLVSTTCPVCPPTAAVCHFCNGTRRLLW
jgi:hypothetical protein